MDRRSAYFVFLLFLLSLGLSACAGLLPAEEPVGEFGPALSMQEQQTLTFKALWEHLEDNYVYFENSGVDWPAVQARYQARIDAGLTHEEFVGLMEDLEAELPAGTFIYQTRSDRVENEVATTTVSEGIGVFVSYQQEPRPHIVLLDVIAGSPAEKAGLKPHDSILEIEGSPIPAEEGLAAIERIRGPAGSTVTLSIQSPGAALRSVEVTRGKYSAAGKLKAGRVAGTSYGYLLFPPAGYGTLAEDVLLSVQSLSGSRPLRGLVLDLRIASARNGWPLQAVYTLFADGALGEFYNREETQPIEVQGRDTAGSQNVPLVILVGGHTAGLPEILAAALQSQERAIVIGAQTPGAIEITAPFYLPDGSQAFIESTSFMLADGGEPGQTGVVPDIEMEPGWDEVAPERDPLLERAIEYLDGQQ